MSFWTWVGIGLGTKIIHDKIVERQELIELRENLEFEKIQRQMREEEKKYQQQMKEEEKEYQKQKKEEDRRRKIEEAAFNKKKKAKENIVETDAVQKNDEYSVESLFPAEADVRALYDRIKELIISMDPEIEEYPKRLYVAYKIGKRNIISLWPRREFIEVVLNAKLGQIIDKHDLIYDISNRQWSSEQYAFKYFENTDTDEVKDIIQQVIDLKKKI